MSVVVIKVGGAFLQNVAAALDLLEAIKQLQTTHQVVLVHGGGSAVEQLLKDLGMTSNKLNGLRITPDDQIDYVVGALAGTNNKNLCGLAIQSAITPVGLCLADGGMTQCEQISEQLGCVGKVSANNPLLLQQLLAGGFLPIISSIGADDKGKLLNVNADQAATAIAQLLAADLLLLSDVPGVLNADKCLIERLDHDSVEILIKQGVIRDGMTVKVKAAQDAANDLNRPVTIASWKHPESLLKLQRNSGLGTQILPIDATKEAL